MRFSAFIILYVLMLQSCSKNDSPAPPPDPIIPPVAADTLTAGWQLKKIDSSSRILQDMFFVDGNTGFACGDAGMFLKTVNGGNTWIPMKIAISSGNPSCSNIQFLNSQVGFIASFSGVLRTTNGGINWLPSASSFLTTDVFFLNPATGFCTGGGGLYKSIDSGKTWVQIPTAFSSCSSLWFLNTNKGFVTTNSSGLHTTLNGGSGFSQAINSITSNNYSPIYFANANAGCAAFATSVYTTNDGGTNWSLLKQFQHAILDVKNVSATEYYVNTQSEIWHTTDGGNNWIREVKFAGDKIAIEFTLGQPGHVWISCSNGYVCYK